MHLTPERSNEALTTAAQWALEVAESLQCLAGQDVEWAKRPGPTVTALAAFFYDIGWRPPDRRPMTMEEVFAKNEERAA